MINILIYPAPPETQRSANGQVKDTNNRKKWLPPCDLPRRIEGYGAHITPSMFMHYRLPENPEIEYEKDENKDQYREIC